jgi:hypothetical protein
MRPITPFICMSAVKSFLIMVFVLFTMKTAVGSDLTVDCSREIPGPEKTKKLWMVNLTGIGIITAWGIYNWDYFETSPHAESEGWFSDHTEEGGSDKIGHAYTSYVTAHGLSHLYASWCFSREQAALYGALSSLSIMGYMELGDSFSSYGFSHEDLISNILGCAFGYLTYTHQGLRDKIDFRWEYGFHPNDPDFITDYDNSKHLLALKFSGFPATSRGWLKYLELHLGYYTRGFQDREDKNHRNLYAGVGVNLSKILRRNSFPRAARFLNYVQIPGTYMQFRKDLDD